MPSHSVRSDSEVIVLGAGGMGSATCYSLAKRGIRVLAIEQFTMGHAFGSSHGDSRIFRKAYFEHPDYVPLLESSYHLWRDLEQESKAPLYHQTGLIYSCPTHSEILKGVLESATRYGIPLLEVSRHDVNALADRFCPPAEHRFLLEPDAGYLAVENCILSFSHLAQQLGATVVTGAKVTAWRSDGHRVAVDTSLGTFEADYLVVTAGAWSAQLLSDLALPLQVLRKTMFWFGASDAYDSGRSTPCFFFETPDGLYYGFPQSDLGGVKVAEHSGGVLTQDAQTVDRSLDRSELERVRRFVAAALPGVDHASLLRFSTCMYTMTPDANFIIDVHPQYSNVAFAAGFSGHGFKFAPVIGEALADIAATGATRHPVDFLRLRRFA